VGLIAVGIVVAVVASGGSPVSILPDDEPTVPEFAFDAKKPAVITTAQIDPEAQEPTATAQAAAKPAALAVRRQLDGLYTAAFLDPANWDSGTYEPVFAYFDTVAQPEARSQEAVLTAGTGAAGVLESIRPRPSSLKLKVLLDAEGRPTSVSGSVNFTAQGVDAAGAKYTFKSKGQYVLARIDGEWVVVSFSISRHDTDKPAPSPSASPSAEAS
jgi:hypothetical protein